MIFDSYDEAYLKLCGLCRYLPTDLQKRYDSPLFSRNIVANLEEHRLIKKQSNGLSFKLSRMGRKVLSEMGYVFPEDARMDIKRPAYQRKLKNAQWNVLLYLAGIQVFGKTAGELSGDETGYTSSLMMRSGSNMRVLAGTRFLGILRIYDSVYIPYYTDGWIMPNYEKEIFRSQAAAVKGAERLKLILTGDTLEEVWEKIHPPSPGELLPKGMRSFDRALEEMPYETMLFSLNRDGVFQMSLVSCRKYRERIAKGLGCSGNDLKCQCDGMIQGTPYIIGIDMNLERVVKILKQLEMQDNKTIPKIVCFSFQKNVLLKALALYRCPKAILVTLDKKSMSRIFPELAERQAKRKPYWTKEGGTLEVNEKTTQRLDQEAD